MLWDKQTGKPLHPSLVWKDGRTAGVVKRMIEATPTKSPDHLRVSHAPPISVVKLILINVVPASLWTAY